MPMVKLQHIVSVTSEDKSCPAENLLQEDSFKKWKSQAAGEKNVSVTIQFEKASKIHQIDIGNEGSAFVEVLVGKASSKDDDYKVVLVASSFMTPIESRNTQNTNKVRMFGPDKLNKTVIDENWDRIKVVCTQPFNKSTKYGIAFIKVHAPPKPGEKEPPKTQSTLGAFKLKDDKDGDGIKPGSLFANRAKLEKETTPLTGAAAIRAASKTAEEAVKKEITPIKRKSSEELPHEVKKPKRKDSEEFTRSSPPPSKPSTSRRDSDDKPSMRKQSSVSSTTSHASSASNKKGELRRAKSEADKKSRDKPFKKIMDKVVFVMSGFENPQRGQLRDKAIEMGATYKQDWGKTCTHLICAFKNTPKFNQVNGKGRIVEKDWVKDCYKRKKLYPWRDYRLGKSKSPTPSESDTEDEEEYVPKREKTPKKTSNKKKSPAKDNSDDDTDLYGGSTDENTDDEIERIKASKAKEEKEKNKSDEKSNSVKTAPASVAMDDDDIYDAPTDEEDNTTNHGGLIPLPDFFKGKLFFLYGKMAPDTRRTMKRYIVAYNGQMESYMSEKTNYVLTESQWDDNFDQATLDNPSLIFVRPDWILKCHDQQKMTPFQKFIVVPN